jgi:hypothetical protein
LGPYLLSSTKSENKREEKVLYKGKGWHSSERGGGGRSGYAGEFLWCKKCVHMYVNAKMVPVETILGIRSGGIKESPGRGEFKYEIFDTL